MNARAVRAILALFTPRPSRRTCTGCGCGGGGRGRSRSHCCSRCRRHTLFIFVWAQAIVLQWDANRFIALRQVSVHARSGSSSYAELFIACKESGCGCRNRFNCGRQIRGGSVDVARHKSILRIACFVGVFQVSGAHSENQVDTAAFGFVLAIVRVARRRLLGCSCRRCGGARRCHAVVKPDWARVAAS